MCKYYPCRVVEACQQRNRYIIYSAVFLFKADTFGALSKTEHDEVVDLIQRFIHVMERTASSETHIALRYNKLLKKLWFAHGPYAHATALDNPAVASDSRTIGGSDNPTFRNMDNSAAALDLGQALDLELFHPSFSTLDMDLFSPGLDANMDLSGWDLGGLGNYIGKDI